MQISPSRYDPSSPSLVRLAHGARHPHYRAFKSVLPIHTPPHVFPFPAAWRRWPGATVVEAVPPMCGQTPLCQLLLPRRLARYRKYCTCPRELTRHPWRLLRQGCSSEPYRSSVTRSSRLRVYGLVTLAATSSLHLLRLSTSPPSSLNSLR